MIKISLSYKFLHNIFKLPRNDLDNFSMTRPTWIIHYYFAFSFFRGTASGSDTLIATYWVNTRRFWRNSSLTLTPFAWPWHRFSRFVFVLFLFFYPTNWAECYRTTFVFSDWTSDAFITAANGYVHITRSWFNMPSDLYCATFTP